MREVKAVRIKPFSGGQQEFSTFKEKFSVIVSRGLSDPEKLFLLKSNVEGEPLALIDSSNSYTVAWELLYNHYGRQ